MVGRWAMVEWWAGAVMVYSADGVLTARSHLIKYSVWIQQVGLNKPPQEQLVAVFVQKHRTSERSFGWLRTHHRPQEIAVLFKRKAGFDEGSGGGCYRRFGRYFLSAGPCETFY